MSEQAIDIPEHLEVDFDWMHNAPWSEGEFNAARRLAEIAREKFGSQPTSLGDLVKLAPEIDDLLPLADGGRGMEDAMRYRVAARARSILTGEVDPNESV